MADNTIYPAADFQALPLEFIISQPLIAVVKAQKIAADATTAFLQSFIDKNKPITLDFSATVSDSSDSKTGTKQVNISAPLLALVPVPHLRIDSLTIDFKYEVTQTLKNDTSVDKGLDLTAKAGIAWFSASLSGHISSSSKQESVMNRSGSLEISVHASESPLPEGLAKVLNLLANSITVDGEVQK